ncbi:methylamine utilization protein [Marinomonas sp. A79]|uniref:Methylamine utilization protein n=1 Tax=Marinomonas vulgaris TaxID=2823372 RepID=A0ABS5HC87_9GAMM|nr:methylamine utilization protein [Marinomonas vulgaris]MBR7889273.1 methylamine utilization protein [Marinomonas vulgaris]
MNLNPKRFLSAALLGCSALLASVFMSSAWSATLTLDVASSEGEVLDYAAVYLEPLSFDVTPYDDTQPPVVIAQKGQVFLPAITVLQTGTRVEFPNLDTVRHHVYSFSEAKTFDIKLYLGRAPSSESFDKPGLVTLGCNIHDAMIAWVVVVDTPYFVLTDVTGKATLEVPDGEYRVKVWDRRQVNAQNDGQVLTVSGNQALALSTDILDFDPYTDLSADSMQHVHH